ncbi:major facilitator superfamily domain-containing protein [Gigaspora rosea]|uniref:MFS-type drug efflux transporter P55 n=1 Tax=Gigaspora rosea TaxID=44941 RepID=A0A397UIH9_9GLOM|nr:major facilitator superfamily domain-containing protein [Gigaspora rosea]
MIEAPDSVTITVSNSHEEKEEKVLNKTDSESTIKNNNNEDEKSTLLSFKELMLVFLALLFAVFLSGLDQMIVATCLPKIVSEFNSLDQITWIGTAYLLTSTTSQPISGKISDIFGRKPTFLLAIGTFLIASTLCGASQNMIMLIVFRGLAGLGAGAIVNLLMIIMSDVTSQRDRGKYQGLVGGVWGLSTIVGPLAGGLFSDHLSWRWAFFINLPIGAVTVIIVILYLQLPKPNGSLIEKLKRIDYLGSILVFIGVVCLLLPTNWGGTTYPWNSPQIITLYIVSFIILSILIYVEVKVAAEPIIPAQLFKIRTAVANFIFNLLFGMAFYSMIFYTPLYFQVIKGVSATVSGLLILPLLLGLVLFSLVAGLLTSYTGRVREFIWLGSLISIIGSVLISIYFNTNSTTGQQIGFLLIIGCGFGFVAQTTLLSIQSCVEIEYLATATAMYNFSRVIGGIFGVAILGAVFNGILNEGLSTLYSQLPPGSFDITLAKNDALYLWNISDMQIRQNIMQIYVNALQSAYRVNVPILVCAFLSSLFLKHHVLQKTITK